MRSRCSSVRSPPMRTRCCRSPRSTPSARSSTTRRPMSCPNYCQLRSSTCANTPPGRWAQGSPEHIALAVEGALLAQDNPAARARLVETLGLVPGAVATRALVRAANDATEPVPVRMAAISALGDRGADPEIVDMVRRLATAGGELAGVARLAEFDLAATRP